jgi:hypothetical protein
VFAELDRKTVVKRLRDGRRGVVSAASRVLVRDGGAQISQRELGAGVA